MNNPVAWRRLEHGRWDLLWIQVHREGAVWRVTMEEDRVHEPQLLFHGAGPARDVAIVANQVLEECRHNDWRIITGSSRGTFSPWELDPRPVDTTPIRTLTEALFAS